MSPSICRLLVRKLISIGRQPVLIAASRCYWSVRVGDRLVEDLAWSYRTPLPESRKIAGLVAFYNERVDLFIDNQLQRRPVTKFSK